jgi:hypothetical protein
MRRRYARVLFSLLLLTPSSCVAEQPDAHYRLGRVYQATGNQAAAQREFAKVGELHEKAEEDVARKMSAVPPPLEQ